MKKSLLLFLFISALTISCSNDDDKKCECDAQYGVDGIVWYTERLEINCSTRQPVVNPTSNPHPEYKFMGCKK